MARTTLKPWSQMKTLVEIESSEILSEEEKEEVEKGIRIAFSWCVAGEWRPSLSEIQQAIESNFQTELANKLVSMRYC